MGGREIELGLEANVDVARVEKQRRDAGTWFDSNGDAYPYAWAIRRTAALMV